MSLSERDGWTLAGQLLGSVLLLVSAGRLPWASWRTFHRYVGFRTGRLDEVLIDCSLLSLALVVIGWVWRRRSVCWLQLGLGCISAVCSVALALNSISNANHLDVAGNGVVQTSYGIGSAVGIAGSILLVTSSAFRLERLRTAHRRQRQASPWPPPTGY